MKATITTLLFLLCFFVHAQKIEQFYDYRWRPTDVANACFYTVIEPQNSLWQRKDYFIRQRTLQMAGAYKDKECEVPQGPFSYYYVTGSLEFTGSYEDGKRQGLWLHYHPNGMMKDSATYNNDQVVGMSLSWHPNGYPADSSVIQNDGSGMSVSWFDNGNPSAAGRFTEGKKQHGKWQYFHKNGQLSAEEVFDAGKLVSRNYFDENGTAIQDTTNKDREASFVGGLSAWQRYLSKQVYFPKGYEITNSDQAVVVVTLTIDEEGKVEDAWVNTPFHPEFDKLALAAVRKSPKWQPAISHNRKVKYYARQPVTFAQQ